MSDILPDRWMRSILMQPERGIQVTRGQGSYVWDDDDVRYLDMTGNHGSILLGYGHAAVTAAIAKQAHWLTGAHHTIENNARDELIEALSLMMPEPISRLALVNSGSEAVEIALKCAREATRRPRFVAMDGADHGRGWGALSVSGDARSRARFAPLLPQVTHVRYDDVDSLRAEMDDRVAAVIVEPIQAEAGVRVPSDGYLSEVERCCREWGALLIVDEVQTALRTGRVLAYTREEISPDIVCLARGLGGGLPIGVMVTTGDAAERLRLGWHDSTESGSPVVCAAANATVRCAIDPAVQTRARLTGEHLLDRLSALRLPEIREVRGRGLMIAIELRQSSAAVVAGLMERGILVSGKQGVIRLLPPLTLERRQADVFVEALAATILTSRPQRHRTPVSDKEVILTGRRRLPAETSEAS